MEGLWWVEQDELDTDQKEAIDLPLDANHLIYGPPGSGKTNLVLLRAKYLVRSGVPNVCIVVFTRTLHEFISLGCAQYGIASNKLKTSVSLFNDILHQYNIEPDKSEDFSALRENLSKQVKALLEEKKLSNFYDVILLDEAQDYSVDEIDIFRILGRNIFAVADARQMIFSGKDPLPKLESIAKNKITLRFHYRNGYKICRLADGIAKVSGSYSLSTDTSHYDEIRYPSTAELVKCLSLEEQCLKILSNVKTQLKAYPRALIGVLCPRNNELKIVYEILSATEISDYIILQGLGNGYSSFEDKPICLCNVHNAKGLEFRALHIAGVDFFDNFKKYQRNMVYTAITRAKTSMSVYYTDILPGYLESAFASLSKPSRPSIKDLF
ncbi:ATP-binding domain-containing protein [Desulfovibrio sp. DV]|uniref:ATP-binding domain-containing protein n=1 Tax=Desulfovibrio sp. DV TaxID=1844708 RepID=UPI00094B8CD7|nr:ATP-binding domain-containing protein [Desulfovibrio sp. DV]